MNLHCPFLNIDIARNWGESRYFWDASDGNCGSGEKGSEETGLQAAPTTL